MAEDGLLAGEGGIHDGPLRQDGNSADLGQPCDDGDPCTHSDHIVMGTCKGTSYSCDDGDACTQDSCAGDGTCVLTPLDVCTIGYAIDEHHPGAGITYSKNRIVLNRIIRRANGSLARETISDMGSFKDSPQYWDVWYDHNSIPPKCYDRSAAHAGTLFEGLNQGVYPAPTKAGLVQKLRAALPKAYTYRWPSNASGGNLCTSGNWWSVIKFTAKGIDHVEALLAKP